MEGTIHSRIGYELKRVQHRLRAEMDGALRAAGLTTPQYAVLANLRDAPKASGAELARLAFVTPQTMHEVLQGLERSGLIARDSGRRRGRRTAARLTEEGLIRVENADVAVRAIERRLVAGLDSEERQRLLAYLARCADALGPSGRPPQVPQSPP